MQLRLLQQRATPFFACKARPMQTQTSTRRSPKGHASLQGGGDAAGAINAWVLGKDAIRPRESPRAAGSSGPPSAERMQAIGPAPGSLAVAQRCQTGDFFQRCGPRPRHRACSGEAISTGSSSAYPAKPQRVALPPPSHRFFAVSLVLKLLGIATNSHGNTLQADPVPQGLRNP